MRKDIPIITGVLLLIISILFDKQIINFIVSLRNDILTDFMHLITFLGTAIFVIIFTALLFAFDKNTRRYIPALLLTLALTVFLAVGLKYIIARPRPLAQALEFKTNYSFPSTHAAMFFAPFVLIDKLFPKLKWFWLVIGAFVLISRIYLGVHYMSDVIAGALLGYLTGILALRMCKVNF